MSTTDFILRLPPGLAQTLTEAAKTRGMSRNALIANILDRANSDLTVGYVEVFRGGLDGAECPECDQIMTRLFIGFTVGVIGPQAFGPFCENCATTE